MEQIRSVAVIGAGDRGRAFALHCAACGYPTALQDVLSSKLRAAESLLAEHPAAVRNQLRLASSIEDSVRDADLAIDFVPDELESKLEIFSLLDRMAPPKTILCTPTQLSITDLGSCTYRADRCLAIGFEANASGRDVQVIRGEKTGDAISDAVSAWFTSLGYRVHVFKDPDVTVQAAT